MPFIVTYPMRNSTILRITSEIETIEMSPEYQRRGDIWTLDKRELLIDSIINDYDIPKLYFYVLPKGGRHQYAIIDGRQRIETILSFVRGSFALSEDFKYLAEPSLRLKSLTYPDIVKQFHKVAIRFDSYVLPIVCVETDNMDLIEDMFSRLNEAVPLNAAEKRNALGGPMVRTITGVSEHQFFAHKVSFSNKGFQHREVSARLLYVETCLSEYGRLYDTKKPYLDDMVKRFKKDTNLKVDPIRAKVVKNLDSMCTVFANKDPLLKSQAIVTVYYLLIKVAVEQGRLSDVTRGQLIAFRDKVAANRKVAEKDITKADFELLEFDRMSVQGTNDAASITERARIIATHFRMPVPQYH